MPSYAFLLATVFAKNMLHPTLEYELQFTYLQCVMKHAYLNMISFGRSKIVFER